MATQQPVNEEDRIVLHRRRGILRRRRLPRYEILAKKNRNLRRRDFPEGWRDQLREATERRFDREGGV